MNAPERAPTASQPARTESHGILEAPSRRWLLAAALATAEAEGSPPDERAEDAARSGAESEDAERILVWADAHRDAAEGRRLLEAIERSWQAIWWWGLLVLFGIAAFGGFAAARASLQAVPVELAPRAEPGVTNIVRMLVGLLGVQSLLLVAWIAFLLLPVVAPGAGWRAATRLAPVGSIGALFLSVLRSPAVLRLSGAVRSPLAAAALAARWKMFTAHASLRALFAAISNGAWSTFNLFCIATLLLLLSTQGHRFAWETTILSAPTYARAVEIVGWLPSVMGFEGPTATQVMHTEASRATLEALDDARAAWAGFLIGALVVYGLLPRAALACGAAGVALAGWMRSPKIQTGLRSGLVHDPALAFLRERLRPIATRVIVDPDHPMAAPSSVAHPTPRAPQASSSGSERSGIAVVGIEPPRPWTPWPPTIANLSWRDLGIVDDRSSRMAALERLRTMHPAPRAVVVTASLLNTPDRGEAAVLGELASAAATVGAPILVLLADGQALRERLGADDASLERRVELWRELLNATGLARDAILELDLANLTDRSVDRLMSHPAIAERARAASERRENPSDALALAFAEISACARRDSLDAAAQTELLRSIAALFRDGGSSLPKWFDRDWSADPSVWSTRMTRAAGAMRSILPPAMALDPRWLAAGATAGALGCVAIASLATPLALGMLPMWSAVGAAATAVVRAAIGRDRSPHNDQTTTPAATREERVRSAALFAVVLALQGEDEAVISRRIGAALHDGDSPSLEEPWGVDAWLAGVRQRFDASQHPNPRRSGA